MVSVVNLNAWGWSWVVTDGRWEELKNVTCISTAPLAGVQPKSWWQVQEVLVCSFLFWVPFVCPWAFFPSSAAVGLMCKPHITSQQGICCLRASVVFR